MDRIPRRLRCSLLSVLLLAGCRSKPIVDVEDPVKVAQASKCAEFAPSRENCGFTNQDVMMVITVMAKPTSEKKDKRNPNVISGACEFHLMKPDGPPDIRPCPDVNISVTHPVILGENGARSVRIGQKAGIIGGLPSGAYNVTASSELYKVNAEVRDVPSGSQVKVQLMMPVKIVPVAPPLN